MLQKVLIYVKYIKEDTQNYSQTVMFRGTPCIKGLYFSITKKMLEAFHESIHSNSSFMFPTLLKGQRK